MAENTKPSVSKKDVSSASGSAKSQDENLPSQRNEMTIQEVSTHIIWNAHCALNLFTRKIKARKARLKISQKKKTQS